MARTSQSKTKHDRGVLYIAKEYEQKDYKVWADLEDWHKPETIGGYRPDVIANRGGHTTVIEVETEDSVDSVRDITQQKAFRQWAAQSDKRHYRRVIV